MKRLRPQHPSVHWDAKLGWQVFLSACLWFLAVARVSAGTWSIAAPLPLGRAEHTATLLTNGRVLVAGGDYGGGDVTSSTLLYDPSQNSWSTTSSLHDARAKHTATRLADGRTLVVGGYRVQRLSGFHIALASAEIYDPATGLWMPTASLAAARYGHTATLLASGKVLVIGGADLNGAVSGVELFDPVTGTWSTPTVMAVPRSAHTSTLLPNGEILVVGGAVTGGDDIAAADRYDPVRNRWSAAGNIGIPRGLHTATLMPTGRVLVAGGTTIHSLEFLASTIRYASSLNNWIPAADMRGPHAAHVALLLNNGLVLVVGGGAPPELYDPVRETWSVEENPPPIGTLTALFATATELADGSVLAVGGEVPEDGGRPTANVRRYTPDTSPPDKRVIGVPTLSPPALFALSVLLLLTAVRGVGHRRRSTRRH